MALDLAVRDGCEHSVDGAELAALPDPTGLAVAEAVLASAVAAATSHAARVRTRRAEIPGGADAHAVHDAAVRPAGGRGRNGRAAFRTSRPDPTLLAHARGAGTGARPVRTGAGCRARGEMKNGYEKHSFV